MFVSSLQMESMKSLRQKIRSFFASLNFSKKTLCMVILVALLSVTLTTAISIMLSHFHNLTIPSLGTIKVVGVETYWDANLETKAETINWGVVQPGYPVNVTIYVKSVSNLKTTLQFNATNWNPSGLSEYMTLSWDYSGTPINAGETIKVTLVMTTSSDPSFIPYLIANNVNEFNVEIHFVALEYS
jgi:hypothetical protein